MLFSYVQQRNEIILIHWTSTGQQWLSI
uniref:Uncharacterized protein n=1 Tax=Arundo donax TaxID=35708 RepID=A0A0A9BLE7_ARUDO